LTIRVAHWWQSGLDAPAGPAGQRTSWFSPLLLALAWTAPDAPLLLGAPAAAATAGLGGTWSVSAASAVAEEGLAGDKGGGGAARQLHSAPLSARLTPADAATGASAASPGSNHSTRGRSRAASRTDPSSSSAITAPSVNSAKRSVGNCPRR